MKALTTLLLVLSTFAAQADLAIYKFNMSTAVTGGFVVRREHSTGFFVWDVATAEIQLVRVNAALKQFSVYYPPLEYTLLNVSSSLRQTLTVIALPPDEGLGVTLFKGTQTPLYLGPLVGIYLIPRSFTIKTTESWIDSLSVRLLTEASGSIVFSNTETVAANATLLDADGAVNNIALRLIALGYTETF